MITNVIVKTCLNQKIIKIRIWFRQWRIAYVREQKLSEGRIFLKAEFVRIFTEYSEVWIEDTTWSCNREVTWSHSYSIFRKTEFVCPNIYRMFRSVDWTHDMIIVKWHLLIWHKRKLCALTNAPPVQSTQTGQWLSTLFHANYSAAQVYVLHPRQFIFALSCRRRSFLQVLQFHWVLR